MRPLAPSGTHAQCHANPRRVEQVTSDGGPLTDQVTRISGAAQTVLAVLRSPLRGPSRAGTEACSAA